MTAEETKALEPMMASCLSRTIDFVKFGEAKNAALLTFTSAWVLASANVAAGEVAQSHSIVRLALMFGAPFLVLAAFLALVSFLPRTNLPKLKGSWDQNARTNYLYFGHLGGLKSDGLHTRLGGLYLCPDSAGLNERYLDDLGCQIIVNSKIAATKFTLFAWGARATAAGLGVYAFAAIWLFVSG